MEHPVKELLRLAREDREDAFLERLDALDARHFVALDERARSWVSGIDRDPTGLLARDGHLRERAVRECVLRRGTLALIALRTTDWVPNVRHAALERLRAAPLDGLVDLLPLVDHLARERERAGQLEALLEGWVDDERLRGAATSADAAVRRSALRRLSSRGAAGAAETAAADRDERVRAVAARAIAGLPPERRRPVARALLGDRVGWIGARALDALVELDGDEVLVPALAARSATVRRRARDWAAARGIDARSVYLERLAADPADAAALLSLAEILHRDDTERLVAALDDPRPRVRAAALAAVGVLEPATARVAALAALDAGSGRVARVAVSVLRRASLTGADLARFEAVALDPSQPAGARVRALSLLRRSRWLHLAILLTLLDEGVGSLDGELNAWLRHSGRMTRAPESRLRETIERHVHMVDPARRRWIEFALRTAV